MWISLSLSLSSSATVDIDNCELYYRQTKSPWGRGGVGPLTVYVRWSRRFRHEKFVVWDPCVVEGRAFIQKGGLGSRRVRYKPGLDLSLHETKGYDELIRTGRGFGWGAGYLRPVWWPDFVATSWPMVRGADDWWCVSLIFFWIASRLRSSIPPSKNYRYRLYTYTHIYIYMWIYSFLWKNDERRATHDREVERTFGEKKKHCS